MGGAPHARSSLIPGPAANEGYWPAAGVVENASTLRVILWHILRGSGGSLSFQPVDMQVATFSLPSLTLQSVQPMPIPTSVDRPYGATVLVAPDGYLYLYGRDNNRDQYVARVQQGQLLTGTYQFWGDPGTGAQWQSDPTKAVPLAVNNMPALLPQLGTGQGPSAEMWVVPYQGGYLATANPAELFRRTVEQVYRHLDLSPPERLARPYVKAHTVDGLYPADSPSKHAAQNRIVGLQVLHIQQRAGGHALDRWLLMRLEISHDVSR